MAKEQVVQLTAAAVQEEQTDQAQMAVFMVVADSMIMIKPELLVQEAKVPFVLFGDQVELSHQQTQAIYNLIF
jgi:hypothetical protein